MKQLNLALIGYVQDYDETFPVAIVGGCEYANCYPTASQWTQEIVPYVKANGVYGCPDDTNGGQVEPSAGNSYKGVVCSYAANGFMGYFNDNSYSGYLMTGVMGVSNDKLYTNNAAAQLSVINHPSDTILLAERFSSDIAKATPGDGNWSNFSDGNVITGVPWFGPTGSQIPDNTRAAAAFPNGPNGGVSAHHTSGTIANFAFTDGHVKAMRPTQTNPQPPSGYDSNGHQLSNLWDARRQ